CRASPARGEAGCRALRRSRRRRSRGWSRGSARGEAACRLAGRHARGEPAPWLLPALCLLRLVLDELQAAGLLLVSCGQAHCLAGGRRREELAEDGDEVRREVERLRLLSR